MQQQYKVFISYAHQNIEKANRIFDFSNQLRREGIYSDIDQYHQNPPEGWPRWMEKQIDEADFVLLVCDKILLEKMNDKESGLGVSWEINLIYNYIYSSNTHNKKTIPIIFNQEETSFIPLTLRSWTYYNVNNTDGFDDLYWRLRGINRKQMPPLGKLRPLPEEEQRIIFISPFDDLKWKKAKWCGCAYTYINDKIPVFGFVFHNESLGREIFQDWATKLQGKPVDDLFNLDFIIPPYPRDSCMYKDKDIISGEEYIIRLMANKGSVIDFSKTVGDKPFEYIGIGFTANRFPFNEASRCFFDHLSQAAYYYIAPIGLIDNTKQVSDDNLKQTEVSTILRVNQISISTGASLNKENGLYSLIDKQTWVHK